MSESYIIEEIQKMFVIKMNKIILDSLCKVGYHLYTFPLFLLGKNSFIFTRKKIFCINCLTFVEHEEVKEE